MKTEEANIQLGYKDNSWFLTNNNLVLLKGQVVYLGQTGTYKLGDGVSKLNELQFLGKATNTVTNTIITNTVINNDDKIMISITVSTNILKGESVNLDGTKSNSSIVGKRDKIAGLANTDINSGFSGDIVVEGILQNSGWSWSINDIIYINGTSLSNTPPSTGFIQKLGVAKNSTTIDIKIGQSILL